MMTTTMTNQQRAAMTMALEALESCDAGDYTTGTVCHPSFDEKAVDKAITALREALAKPQGDWVDLTDDEISLMASNDNPDDWDSLKSERDWLEAYEIGAKEAIAKFKSKNTTPVVPQGDNDLTIAYMVGYEKGKDYMKEKAADLREQIALQGVQSSWYEDGFWDGLVAYEQAIRSMK